MKFPVHCTPRHDTTLFCLSLPYLLSVRRHSQLMSSLSPYTPATDTRVLNDFVLSFTPQLLGCLHFSLLLCVHYERTTSLPFSAPTSRDARTYYTCRAFTSLSILCNYVLATSISVLVDSKLDKLCV